MLKTIIAKTAVACIFVIVTIPVVINFAYLANGTFVTIWGGADMLSYCASLPSSIGTVVLGAIAVYQNKQANELNERLTKIEEKDLQLATQPFTIVTDYKAYSKDMLIAKPNTESGPSSTDLFGPPECEHIFCIELSLTNTTPHYITIEPYSVKVNDVDNSRIKNQLENDKKKIGLVPATSGSLLLMEDLSYFQSIVKQPIEIQLWLENRFAERYKETFVVTILSIKDIIDNLVLPNNVELLAQHYSIVCYPK